MILNFIRGFCMALADSVPGVSGGTVAFLLGFYDKFIGSLDALVAGSMQEKKEAIIFLIKIMVGWVVGFLMAVSILASIFDAQIYKISSLFMGFILFAIPIVVKEERANMKFNASSIIAGIIGIAIVALITYFNPIAGQGSTVDLSSLNISLILYVFVAAMFAISAMVLPGISGSTLLLIFGLYVPIISAVKAVISFNLDYLPILIVFALGILAGIVSVVRVIKWALDKHRSIMIFLIIGMMIGSFYAIIMGPQTLSTPKAPLSFSSFDILWFVVGGLIIFGLQKMKDVTEKAE
ncbi:DUF368 domain-containing protein [Longicatena caecimuris]|uniref:Putative membrane protein n=2 Tax=Longicatena caecimuris TaxID=1796635 RepID=A0A4R3TN12_9FIRM|nr:DUF368 domain-containing protein [Longicatena caecimuris]EFE45730.1 hypothetical protein HMPREF0863_02368 [Erysipelotrichaceae bacterium 5_2_54FAA]SCJ07861.1 Domain of uncharacterised function (DUF368) [uncultured Clostridium sp.]MCR1869232.1 DUF368 domain-containing protein [Longicatena caecimuris]MCU0101846.1 DUF368 domain-containing protein [Longicatena caecimuris]TCU63073.1 putative membrane protein [Longicatena caecimuris]